MPICVSIAFMYELKTEQFSGPIEKLLELIEAKKLEITELNLAEVTADFLRYITQINADVGRESARLLADFIVVASRLLLIKSKALLPDFQTTEEEEKDIKDLEARLQFYRQFKPAINFLKKILAQNKVSISRPLFFGRPPIFYPSDNLKIDVLYSAVKSIFQALEQLKKETQVVKSSIISLEEKIEEIMNRMGDGLRFNKLAEKKSRSEIVVLFLALLYLLSKQTIEAEQNERFSDIMIGKTQN